MNSEIITYLVGENPTVWNWVALILELLLIGGFVNYGVTWLYRYMGWTKKEILRKDPGYMYF